MRELFMTELPMGALTLRPADKVDRAMAMVAFPMWESQKDGRFVVLVTSPEGEIQTDVELDDHWRAYRTFEGLAVELRRADCGAGCRCGGEFRFVGPS